MHRKSRRLLKNIVILSVENPSNHTDNAKKCGAQKIADTLRTRMLGKSPVCQNSGVGKKGEMLENCHQRQQRSKTQISNRRQKILSGRCSSRVCQHAQERKARKNRQCNNEPSGSRTHDRLLRRAKKRSPLSASECLQMPKYQRFPPFSDVRISSKNRLFYPVRVSRVLAASNFGGRPFSHDVRFCQQVCAVFNDILFIISKLMLRNPCTECIFEDNNYYGFSVPFLSLKGFSRKHPKIPDCTCEMSLVLLSYGKNKPCSLVGRARYLKAYRLIRDSVYHATV